MLNQIVLVGRLVSDPEIKETENGNKVSTITLAVPRSYKKDLEIVAEKVTFLSSRKENE